MSMFCKHFFSSVISFGDESKASLISLFKGTAAQLGTITLKVAILFQYIHLCLFTNYLWQIHCSSMIHTCHENWINTYLVITERSLKIIFIQKLFELTVVAYLCSVNDFRALYKVIHSKYYKLILNRISSFPQMFIVSTWDEYLWLPL